MHPDRSPGSRSVLLTLLALGCSGGEEATPRPAPTAPVEARAPAAVTGCEVNFTSETVNGSSLWMDIPDATKPINCNFHRFAYNNFLYLVGGDTPRFLTELQALDDLTAGGWPAAPALAPLKTRRIANQDTPGLNPTEGGQAGDNFSLIDAAGNEVMYQIRINQTMWDAMVQNNWNTSAGLQAAATAYTKDPTTGGVWLPPTATSAGDSIEIKTSWRKYGSDCPSATMFCTPGADGSTWGLLGMHLVQKTPTRGEWVWASFEHVANAPDCQPGFSNPLQQNPRDPSNPTATINVNSGELAAATGWTSFNFKTYGGDGTTCAVPNGTPSPDYTSCVGATGTPLCNTDPTTSKPGVFQQVNVCRTLPIPDHSTPASVAAVCASTSNSNEAVEDGNNVACITQSVLDNWPQGLDPRWKYYMLIGAEWLNADAVPTTGCVSMTDEGVPGDSFTCAQPDPAPPTPVTYPSFPTTGTGNLANTTMETWMQAGTCMMATGQPQLTSATDCLACHEALTQASGEGDFSHVFVAFATN